jgi:hypothetical protein
LSSVPVGIHLLCSFVMFFRATLKWNNSEDFEVIKRTKSLPLQQVILSAVKYLQEKMNDDRLLAFHVVVKTVSEMIDIDTWASSLRSDSTSHIGNLIEEMTIL